MCGVIIRGFAVFVLSLALHVIVWRIHRPDTYREWLPILVVIFGPVAAAVAWLIAPTPIAFAALLLLH
jgi:hypothetical protein